MITAYLNFLFTFCMTCFIQFLCKHKAILKAGETPSISTALFFSTKEETTKMTKKRATQKGSGPGLREERRNVLTSRACPSHLFKKISSAESRVCNLGIEIGKPIL